MLNNNPATAGNALTAAGQRGGGGFDPKCLEILADIMCNLLGGQMHTVGRVTVTRLRAVKRAISERYAQLRLDPANLFVNHRTEIQRHPTFGSWEGHQKAYENQQQSLRNALKDWASAGCGGPGGAAYPTGRGSTYSRVQWIATPVPDRPATAAQAQADSQLERRYTLVFDSDVLPNLTIEQALQALRGRVEKTSRRIDMQSGEHKLVKENRDEHFFTGWWVDRLGGVSMPSLMIWQVPRGWVEGARAAVPAGDADQAARKLAQAENAYYEAREIYVGYKEGIETGAERAVVGAKVVAVGAAVVFVGAGVVVAAGAVAGAGTAAATAAATTTTSECRHRDDGDSSRRNSRSNLGD